MLIDIETHTRIQNRRRWTTSRRLRAQPAPSRWRGQKDRDRQGPDNRQGDDHQRNGLSSKSKDQDGRPDCGDRDPSEGEHGNQRESGLTGLRRCEPGLLRGGRPLEQTAALAADEKEPGDDPGESRRANDQERHAPASERGQVIDDQGRDHRTNRCARIEDPVAEAAVSRGQHARRDPQGARPVERFPDSQKCAADDQPAQAGHECRRCRGHRPPRDRRGIGRAQAEAVNQEPRRYLKQGIGHEECGDHPAEVDVFPDREILLDLIAHQRDRLAVHVIENGRGKHQPAEAPCPGARARGVFRLHAATRI